MKHLTILTGASRGLGFALAEQLCHSQAQLLCIARTHSPELALMSQQRGGSLEQWQADLADPIAVAQRLQSWLASQAAHQWASATLINNAGVIGHLGPLDLQHADNLATTLAIDLEAPMLLCAAFLNASRAWSIPKKVLNISSGLGRRAMAGSAVYCAAKAGMDHFTRCAALDEALHANGAKLVSLAPGVIDTDMQTDLRAGDGQLFPERGNFVKLKESGALATPAQAAARVLAYLARADFGSNPVASSTDA